MTTLDDNNLANRNVSEEREQYPTKLKSTKKNSMTTLDNKNLANHNASEETRTMILQNKKVQRKIL
jgi:hypothetical protein